MGAQQVWLCKQHVQRDIECASNFVIFPSYTLQCRSLRALLRLEECGVLIDYYVVWVERKAVQMIGKWKLSHVTKRAWISSNTCIFLKGVQVLRYMTSVLMLQKCSSLTLQRIQDSPMHVPYRLAYTPGFLRLCYSLEAEEENCLDLKSFMLKFQRSNMRLISQLHNLYVIIQLLS